jgi:hypothetical protein
MREDQKKVIKEQKKRAGKILSTIDRNRVVSTKEEGLDSLKIKVYSKAWAFAVLAFVNAGVIGYTYFLNEKPKVVNLYSTSYTAEVERLEFLRTKEQVSNTLIEFKMAHQEKVSTLIIDKGTIKGL